MIIYEDDTKHAIPMWIAPHLGEKIDTVRRFVPNGKPFWIVPDIEIDMSDIFRDAWEIPDEWGECDGYGESRL